MIRRRAGVAVLAVVAAACSHATFRPPAGPGLPAPDAPDAWQQATSRCRAARTYVAVLRVSGRVGAARLPPLTIDTAVTSDEAIYLSATAVGRAIFVLAGQGTHATLWLRREHRRVEAPPAEILEAILGVPLSPDRLLAVASGCGTRAFDIVEASASGRWLNVATIDGQVYLERRDGRWHTRAAVVDDFMVEFVRDGTTLPGTLRIRSTPGRDPGVALEVRATDAEQNGAVPASVFQAPAAAAGAAPMTIEELRRWAADGRGSVSAGKVSWPMPRALVLRPFAKINLTLRVGRRMEDGFHDVRTLMQSIGVSDTLTITPRRGPFSLQTRAPGVPADRGNLVWRAADALWRLAGRTGEPRDVHVRLEKAIPPAAGLGGGSADAAAALIGLNAAWELRRPRRDLVRLAASLGADVPFFLQGGTALGTGRGDEVYPVDDIARFGIVVIKPSFGVSTADAYRWLDEDRAAAVAPSAREPREVDLGWPGGPLALVNDLEAPVARRHPGIEEMIEASLREGALAAAMTGSGSAVFGVFPEAVAPKAARRLRRAEWLVLLSRTISRTEAARRLGL